MQTPHDAKPVGGVGVVIPVIMIIFRAPVFLLKFLLQAPRQRSCLKRQPEFLGEVAVKSNDRSSYPVVIFNAQIMTS